MGDWQFYGTGDAPMGTISKPPRYGLRGGRVRNVVASETLGGLVRSETRGPDRRTLALDWRRIVAADVAILDAIHAAYGGNAGPLRIQLPDGVLPGVVGGAVVRVRWPETHFQPTLVESQRYDASLTLVEDLATSLVASGSITQANAHLSLIAGTAFVDLVGVDLSAYANGRHYLMVTDSAGRRFAGWLKAAGTGPTYGADLAVNGGFGSDTAGWSPTNAILASIAGGQSGNCLEMTRTAGPNQAAASGPTGITIDALYLAGVYVKSGSSGNEAFRSYIYDGEKWVYVAGTSSGSWVAYGNAVTAVTAAWTQRVDKMTATAGTMLFDSVTLNQVLTPSATGATIVSTREGATYTWAFADTGFTRNDPGGYRYAIYSY